MGEVRYAFLLYGTKLVSIGTPLDVLQEQKDRLGLEVEIVEFRKVGLHMQITVNRADLATAFTWVAGGLPRRPALPVLQGVRLTVEGPVLTLAAFDYEQSRKGLVAHYGSANDKFRPGQILVDGPQLKKIISSLPKGTKTRPVTVDINGDVESLTITASGITWTLPALPADEYPDLPELPPVAGVIDGAEFARKVQRVARAAGRDDTLPSLTCIQFTLHDKTKVVIAATDRYRLAHDAMSWTPAGTITDVPPVELLIPAKTATEFAKAAGKFGKVQVHVSEFESGYPVERVGFSDDMRELTTHPMSGDYPRWQGLLRAASPVNLTVDAKALAETLNRMSTVTYFTKNFGGAVDLHYSEGTLTVHALAENLTDTVATESVPAEADLRGFKEFTVRFCPEYMLSMLQGVNGKARIGLAGTTPGQKNEFGRITGWKISGVPEDMLLHPKPATINAVEADTFGALVMPARPPEPAYSKAA